MANTSRFWNAVISKIRQSNPHPLGFFVLLVLVTIPLGYAVNSISLGLLGAAAIFNFRKFSFKLQPLLLLPVLLYLLMSLSLLWTVDPAETSSALAKELPLLVIPVIFMLAPAFDTREKNQILRGFATVFTLYVGYWLLAATARFVLSGNPNVFFYHELVTLDLNAIHVSVYASVAFFVLQNLERRPFWALPALWMLGIFILLLSSKNIIVIFVFLLGLRALMKKGGKPRWGIWAAVISVSAAILFAVPQTRERFMLEARTMFESNTVNTHLSRGEDKVYNVSIAQAWSQEKFEPNHFFPGAAFRVYQFRVFCELVARDKIFFSGYGLNASYKKIRDKTLEDNLYQGNDGNFGYNRSNFHNQYVQVFAELGFFGFLLLVAMVLVNLKIAFAFKDFAHISFAVLMISLFLTESFLWRQRGVIFFTMLYCLFLSGAAPARNNR